MNLVFPVKKKFNEDIIANRPEAVNLLSIYSALSNESLKEVF